MKFKQVKTSIDFDQIKAISEKWEMGVRTQLFGFSVSANPIGFSHYVIDYPCGADGGAVMRVFFMVQLILSSQPEDLTEEQAKALFPAYKEKPIYLDDNCWSSLNKLASECMGEG